MSCRDLARALLVALLCGAAATAPAPAWGQTAKAIARLRAALARDGANVEKRFRLATLLSWRGAREQARVEAARVVARRPEHWDAQLLVARLDAWAGRYRDARRRILRIYPKLPRRAAALRLLLQVIVWSKQPEEAQRIVQQVREYEESAEVYYLMAVAERQQYHYWAAYQLAGKALELNPLSPEARKLRENTRMVGLDAAYQLAFFPGIDGERVGHGVMLAVSVLPRHWLSLTLTNQYWRRYGTDNNQLSLQLDWRLTRTLLLSGFAGFGAPAEAVARGFVGASLAMPIGWIFDGSIGYRYDRPAWGGNLHRWRAEAGAYLPAGFRLTSAYTLGALTRCSTANWLHGVSVRAIWEGGPIEAHVEYGFGMEIDVPPLNPLLYDGEGCPRPGSGVTEPLTSELRAHSVGAQLTYNLSDRHAVRGGYAVQLRFDGRQVHVWNLGFRTWF